VSEQRHSISIDVPPTAVYGLVTDIARMASWSPEVIRCRWIRGATGPTPGAKFRGWCRNGWRTWSTVSAVTRVEEPGAFEWHVTYLGLPVATWRYSIEPSPTGSLLTESVIDERGALLQRVSPYITGSRRRDERNQATMTATLERIKAAAEATA
jgi:uncharacterized protein YndB with AHSA1/START domain